MTREFKAGDKIRFTGVSDYKSYVTKGEVYRLYEDEDGWLCLTDDDGDKAYFTNAQGELRGWLDDCSFEVVSDSDRVMIDAEELLKLIDGGTRYNMNVEEVIAYLRGFIHAHKEENR